MYNNMKKHIIFLFISNQTHKWSTLNDLFVSCVLLFIFYDFVFHTLLNNPFLDIFKNTILLFYNFILLKQDAMLKAQSLEEVRPHIFSNKKIYKIPTL